MTNHDPPCGQYKSIAKEPVPPQKREARVRCAPIVLLVLSFSVACFGQQAGDSTITVSGCMIGINGSFKLSTHEGERYVLKGDHSTLFSYNGMLVEVTGTMKAAKKSSSHVAPATLHVSKVKKLADSCQ